MKCVKKGLVSASMMLLDDKFSIITETVKDVRRIFENIQKAIGYARSFILILISVSSMIFVYVSYSNSTSLELISVVVLDLPTGLLWELKTLSILKYF